MTVVGVSGFLREGGSNIEDTSIIQAKQCAGASLLRLTQDNCKYEDPCLVLASTPPTPPTGSQQKYSEQRMGLP